jgi:hypothetical protein
MCCATKNFLINVIVWLIAILGITPVSQDWVVDIEEWLGYAPSNNHPVIQYYSEDDLSLYATIQAPQGWDDGTSFPAVLTFHQTGSESPLAFRLSEHLAERGYVSISFGYPAPPTDGSTDGLDRFAQAAMHWTYENSDSLGINPLLIALWGRGDHDNAPAQLALQLLTEDQSQDPIARPSVLFLISSRQFLESEMADEGTKATDDSLPIFDIQSGLPSTILLVSDDATSEQQAFAAQFQDKLGEMGNDCEIVVYEGGMLARSSEDSLEGEFEAVATAMHEVLRSISFWNEEE